MFCTFNQCLSNISKYFKFHCVVKKNLFNVTHFYGTFRDLVTHDPGFLSYHWGLVRVFVVHGSSKEYLLRSCDSWSWLLVPPLGSGQRLRSSQLRKPALLQKRDREQILHVVHYRISFRMRCSLRSTGAAKLSLEPGVAYKSAVRWYSDQIPTGM